MNTENVWIVVVLVVVIFAVTNAVMFAIARGARNGFNIFKNTDATQFLRKEESDVTELSQRVQKLREQQSKDGEKGL
jgi:hypothetical protein